MRNIIVILLSFVSLMIYSQDPSFSQSDIGSLYMNPAYSGSAGHPKFLSIRREQWKDYNLPSDGDYNENIGGIRPFTTNLAEFSTGITIDEKGMVGLRTIGLGASFMAEDHLLSPDLLANTIFLRRSDYQAYLSGLFKWGKTNPLFKKNGKKSIIHYGQFGISYGQSIYGLKTDGIVTSAMLTPYTLDYSGLPNPAITIQDLAINAKPFHKLVIGYLHAFQGNTNISDYQKTDFGFAWQRMTEGFNNNALTSKITIHAKHKGAISDWNIKMIPYWNTFIKRELYYEGAPLTKKVMGKTEIGGSIDIGKSSPLELGSVLRFTSNYNEKGIDVNWQTFSPFVRINIRGERHAFQLSYCQDVEHTLFTRNEEDLYINNTGITNELSFSIILWGGKGPKECIDYGLIKNNGLLQDIKKNGLLNKGGF